MIDPEEIYRRTTPASRSLHERAAKVMPGGTTRTTTYFDPYPLYIDRGEGCRIWDADGTERIDMLGNYTAMILGHAHPKVVEAIKRQAARGTAFAAANPIEVELATLLCERVPSLDQVRFCNSGTEATMFAMRLARAFTGRPKIARIEGFTTARTTMPRSARTLCRRKQAQPISHSPGLTRSELPSGRWSQPLFCPSTTLTLPSASCERKANALRR